jgi:hypothetical protein
MPYQSLDDPLIGRILSAQADFCAMLASGGDMASITFEWEQMALTIESQKQACSLANGTKQVASICAKNTLVLGNTLIHLDNEFTRSMETLSTKFRQVKHGNGSLRESTIGISNGTYYGQ